MIREDVVEKAAVGWFESMGFETHTGAEISPGSETSQRSSHEGVVLERRLLSALRRINSRVPEEALDQVVRVVTRPPEPSLVLNNRWFHRLLTDGIDIEYRTADGEARGDKAWLVDFESPRSNDLLVVRQFTVQQGNKTRRLDLVVFVNGIPIAVIELKDPTDEQADLWSAFRQLQDYKQHIPALFSYNELMVISDGDSTRVGSLTAASDRFAPWRSVADRRLPGQASLEVLIRGLFERTQLLDYVRHGVTFDEDDRSGEIVKKVAGYHQFRAMRNARASVQRALKPGGDGRGGVVWHTQGSGKSLTMLLLAGALISGSKLGNPTIVVVTDRNDLDDQLFDTFAAVGRSCASHLGRPKAEEI